MNLQQTGESGKKTVKSLLGKMGSRQWVILLLLGLLLTVIALPVSDKKDSSPEVKSSSFFQLLLRKKQMQNGQFWRKNWKIFYPRQKEWEKCGCSL